MSLVNIDSLHRQVLQAIGKTEAPAGLELSSYKRNRSIALSVLADQQVLIRENGYHEEDMKVELDKLSRILKVMIKREFPRSRKVRVARFSDPLELDRPRKIL